jgi:methylated-DNA-protein-cysteine methyltransferase-like protein
LTEFADRVRAVVRSIPSGDVTTYGEVAALAGKPGAGRGAGAALAASSADDLPWWRVVDAQGRLAPGKEVAQRRRLVAEGVAVENGFVRGIRKAGRRPRPATSTS